MLELTPLSIGPVKRDDASRLLGTRDESSGDLKLGQSEPTDVSAAYGGLTYTSFRACSSEAHPAHKGHNVVTDSYRACLRALVS
jgi:hypothetical protein